MFSLVASQSGASDTFMRWHWGLFITCLFELSIWINYVGDELFVISATQLVVSPGFISEIWANMSDFSRCCCHVKSAQELKRDAVKRRKELTTQAEDGRPCWFNSQTP